MPLIDLSAPRTPAAVSPAGRRRRQATALAAVALTAVLTGAAGYAALRPASAASVPDTVPGPPAAAAAREELPPSRFTPGIPASAVDPAHISPAPRS